MNNTETTDDDTVNFSLLFQGVLMLGWIMFSVPAVFWGGILPFATVRYRYMKDQMTVGNVNMGHGSTHALPIANGALTLSGKNPLPFEDDEIVNVLSYAFTAAASLWAWWKNNSFTQNAIKADKVLDALNSGETEVVVK